MTGHAFIVHTQGWGCSNSVVLDKETDIVDMPDGTRVGRQQTTLKFTSLFDGIGEVHPDMQVECVMISDDDTKQYGYLGRVKQTGNLTIVNITGYITDCKSIIKKIK